jgi:hypothetical protein
MGEVREVAGEYKLKLYVLKKKFIFQGETQRKSNL